MISVICRYNAKFIILLCIWHVWLYDGFPFILIPGTPGLWSNLGALSRVETRGQDWQEGSLFFPLAMPRRQDKNHFRGDKAGTTIYTVIVLRSTGSVVVNRTPSD